MLPSQISAVVVTRGDRDITPVVESLRDFGQVIVWSNHNRVDRKVFGRFLAGAMAKYPVIYCQDDDCIVDAAALCAMYGPGWITANMPADRRAEYRDTGITLIGWGVVFHKIELLSVLQYLGEYPADDLFYREADRIFTYLNRDRIRQVEVPFRQLPYAHGDDRMGREDRHRADFMQIRRRLASIETAHRTAQ